MSSPLPKFICWLRGSRVTADDITQLTSFATAMGVATFLLYEVDDENATIHHLVAQAGPEEWRLVDREGQVRFVVPTTGSLQEWATAYIGQLDPLTALDLSPEQWTAALRDPAAGFSAHPLYTPLGFGLPQRSVEGGWAFWWCPAVVAGHLAPLNAIEREALLVGMYARLAWWTEMDEEGVHPDERDYRLDERMLAYTDPAGRQCWIVMNRVLVAALEPRG